MPKAKPKIDKEKVIADFGKKAIQVDDIVSLAAHVAGLPPGTPGNVTEVKADGSLFRVEIIKGLGIGKDILVCANDLDDIVVRGIQRTEAGVIENKVKV